MVSGRLYWKDDRDPIMRLCIDKEAAIPYLENAHVALDNMHLSPKQTLKRVQRMGVYWPTMYRDVHKHIRECTCQMEENQALMNAITLYKISPVAPRWAEEPCKNDYQHSTQEDGKG